MGIPEFKCDPDVPLRIKDTLRAEYNPVAAAVRLAQSQLADPANFGVFPPLPPQQDT